MRAIYRLTLVVVLLTVFSISSAPHMTKAGPPPPTMTCADFVAGQSTPIDGKYGFGQNDYWPIHFNAGETLYIDFQINGTDPEAWVGIRMGNKDFNGWSVEDLFFEGFSLEYTFGDDVDDVELEFFTEFAADSAEFVVTCYPVAAPKAPGASTNTPPGPGPDMIPIPAQAVVGTLLVDTPLYFAARADAATNLTMQTGKTLWVFGVNADGTFYQVVLAGRRLWLPVGVVGPTPAYPWNGKPLPTTVVG